MKKHPLLLVDYHSSTKLKSQDQKTLDQYLATASKVFAELLKENVIKGPLKKQYHLSLLICGDARIRKLNKEYRHKDKVTDVLSFPAFDELRKKSPAGGELQLGDMAICFPQTIRQAKEFKIGTWDEFIHLFFHGLLHLMGYDHEVSLKEEKIMQKWEDRALEIFSGKKKGSR
jgi:probable rRNA maturation factor